MLHRRDVSDRDLSPFSYERRRRLARCPRLRDAAQSDNLSNVHFHDRRSVKRRRV